MPCNETGFAYFNDTRVRVLDRKVIHGESCVLVEWPNAATAHSGIASRSWEAASDLRPGPRTDVTPENLLIAAWPGLTQRIPTGGAAPNQPRGLLILHAHAMAEQAIHRRDELLAEAQGLGVPTRALAPLIGVSFNTVARWIKAARRASAAALPGKQ